MRAYWRAGHIKKYVLNRLLNTPKSVLFAMQYRRFAIQGSRLSLVDNRRKSSANYWRRKMTRTHSSRNSIVPSVYFLTILSALALFSGGAVALETTSAIRGTVTDENGTPIVGSTITVRNEDTALSRSVRTDPFGAFSIRNLQLDDNYTVTVEKTGYEIKSIRE